NSSRRARETFATPGRTSPLRASCSATSPASTSPQGWNARPRRSLPESDQRVHILRVIARLNMGGPALHVAYLTEGLRKRGYDTTLERRPTHVEPGDRKSTRLNSSHVAISYAVFCLKKKKKKLKRK